MGEGSPAKLPSSPRKRGSSDVARGGAKPLDKLAPSVALAPGVACGVRVGSPANAVRLRGNDEQQHMSARVRLGDITDSCLGKMLDKEKNRGVYEPYLANLNVRWGGFELSNLSEMRFEPDEEERYGLKSGDLVVCEGGEPGRCAIWREERTGMKFQKALHRLRVKEGYSVEYLFYRMLLAGRTGELAKHFIGSTIKHLTGIGLAQVEFEFPELAEQQRTAAVLAALDAKIDLNNRINAELEALAKTIYDYWFVQFDFPDAHGRPYKSNGGAMVWNDTLKREIPAGWEAGPLGKWISFQRGISYRATEIGDGGTPLINLNSFRLDGSVKLDGTKYYSGEFRADQRVRPGDLVIAITDVTRNADITGRAFVVPDLFGESPLISCDVAAVHGQPYFPAHYLERLFNSEHYHNYLKPFASGTLVLHLNLDGVRWFESFLPTRPLLDRYEAIAVAVRSQVNANLAQNRELTQLRDWLLPLLMNGQVRVA